MRLQALGFYVYSCQNNNEGRQAWHLVSGDAGLYPVPKGKYDPNWLMRFSYPPVARLGYQFNDVNVSNPQSTDQMLLPQINIQMILDDDNSAISAVLMTPTPVTTGPALLGYSASSIA